MSGYNYIPPHGSFLLTPHLAYGVGQQDTDAVFSCPLLKHDPEKHGACVSIRCTRMKDVVQHLRRTHLGPHYCPACYRVWREDVHGKEAWEHHVQNCPEKSKRKSQPQNDEQKYRAMYARLCPGSQQPPSIYLKPFLEEGLSFWRKSEAIAELQEIVNRCSTATALVDEMESFLSSRRAVGGSVQPAQNQHQPQDPPGVALAVEESASLPSDWDYAVTVTPGGFSPSMGITAPPAFDSLPPMNLTNNNPSSGVLSPGLDGPSGGDLGAFHLSYMPDPTPDPQPWTSPTESQNYGGSPVGDPSSSSAYEEYCRILAMGHMSPEDFFPSFE